MKNHPQFEKTAECHTKVMNKINDLMAFWVPVMKLDHWDLSSSFSQLLTPGANNSAAHVAIQEMYEQATFNWCLPILAKMDAADLEETVIHELCHCLVFLCNRKTKRRDIEMTVSRLARIFQAFRYKSEESSS